MTRAVLLAIATAATRRPPIKQAHQPPGLWHLASGIADQRAGRDDQQLSDVSITPFRNPAEAFLATRRALARDETKPGGELAPVAEGSGIGDRRRNDRCDDRPNARDGLQPTADLV
jgi:hypothetical protein